MKFLITGGAGFIGINAAEYFLSKGDNVILFDNLSRDKTEHNLEWIKKKFPRVEFEKGDVRTDTDKLLELVSKVDVVIHLAAQVAVTTSVTNPSLDFETNARGAFNVLEAIRLSPNRPIAIYSSTNKVYGNLEYLKIKEKNGKYQYETLKEGVDESTNLDFHSPYGCSKGCADQYFIDYARIYGLKTIVFRQSCIYGYRQFGVEDQGWIAWFIIATTLGKNLTIYGDGKQVRDVLFITDLVKAYDLAIQNIDKTAGQVFNIGGGFENQLSLLELINHLEELRGKKINFKFSDWRPGDQKVFLCNISKAKKTFGWTPKTSKKEGVRKLFEWVNENKELFNN
ncbi:MAG: GDP-mannose 4,6-dehydratase [archaeon]